MRLSGQRASQQQRTDGEDVGLPSLSCPGVDTTARQSGFFLPTLGGPDTYPRHNPSRHGVTLIPTPVHPRKEASRPGRGASQGACWVQAAVNKGQ